eukprot:3550969-Rhodomonas_salina.1
MDVLRTPLSTYRRHYHHHSDHRRYHRHHHHGIEQSDCWKRPTACTLDFPCLSDSVLHHQQRHSHYCAIERVTSSRRISKDRPQWISPNAKALAITHPATGSRKISCCCAPTEKQVPPSIEPVFTVFHELGLSALSSRTEHESCSGRMANATPSLFKLGRPSMWKGKIGRATRAALAQSAQHNIEIGMVLVNSVCMPLQDGELITVKGGAVIDKPAYVSGHNVTGARIA